MPVGRRRPTKPARAADADARVGPSLGSPIGVCMNVPAQATGPPPRRRQAHLLAGGPGHHLAGDRNERAPRFPSGLFRLAGRTGLEPAASGVTGRRYNRLNYRPKNDISDYVKQRRKEKVAGRTGLEPAASGVTGRRYNRLNYRPTLFLFKAPWWAKQGSNLRHPACKAGALPLSYSPIARTPGGCKRHGASCQRERCA